MDWERDLSERDFKKMFGKFAEWKLYQVKALPLRTQSYLKSIDNSKGQLVVVVDYCYDEPGKASIIFKKKKNTDWKC